MGSCEVREESSRCCFGEREGWRGGGLGAGVLIGTVLVGSDLLAALDPLSGVSTGLKTCVLSGPPFPLSRIL